MLETIVIGSGPAGCSAAVYLKRFNYNVVVISGAETALSSAHQIDNYYGFHNISGKELYQKGLEQLNELGIEVLNEVVTSIEYYGHFIVTTTTNTYEAKRVILATGKARNKLKIKTICFIQLQHLGYPTKFRLQKLF